MEMNELKRKTAEKMMGLPGGNRQDVNHFLKVYGYAQAIARLEGVDRKTQDIIELTAYVHDIACPLCREKYGSCPGHLQEKESEALLREFFSDMDVEDEILERIIHIVTRHHTYEGVDGIDYRIILEADYLVNADEKGHNKDAVRRACDSFFETEAGTEMLKRLYGIYEEET